MREKNKRILGILLALMVCFNIFTSAYQVRAASPTRDQQLQKVVDKALELEGMNYSSPHHHKDIGFNCDGLIWYAYKEAIGHLVPMGPENLDEFGKEIRKEDLRPGDVITYDFRKTGQATHVALYVGNLPGYDKPQIIHAVREGDGYKGRGGVILDNFDRYRPVKKYVRVYEETNAKVADFRVKSWVNLRTNNGNQPYDRDMLIGRFRDGDEIKNAIDYGNFVRFAYNENSTAFAIKSSLEQASPYRDFEGVLTEEYKNDPITPLVRKLWTQASVNVRVNTKGGDILGKIPKGYEIEGSQIGSYYKINYLVEGVEVEGYIYDTFLKDERPWGKGILLEDVELLNNSGSPIASLKVGDRIEGYLENDQIEVVIDGSRGYIARDKVTFDRPVSIWLKEDTKILEYLGQNLEEIENVAEKGRQLKAIELNGYYKIIKDKFNNIEGYVKDSDVKTSPVQSIARVTEDSYVGELDSNKTIGTIKKGTHISGNIIDGYFYFDFEGNYNAKLPLEMISLNLEEEEYLDYWIREDVELKDDNGEVIGDLRKGDQITAAKEESRYKFNYHRDDIEIVVYLEEKYVSETPIARTLYLREKTEMRDEAGNVLGILKKGDKVEAFLDEGRYRIDYIINGEIKKVYADEYLFSQDPIAKDLYIKSRVNVRDNDGNIVDKLSKGKEIEGLAAGNYYKISYNVKGELREGNVYKTFVSEEPVAKNLYVKSSVNVRDNDGNIIDKLTKGDQVEGLLKGNYYHVSYKSNTGLKEGRVHKSFLSQNPIMKDLYIKSRVNVRDENNKVIGKLQRGEKIEGLAVGNRIEFNYKNQKARLVKNFTSEEPVVAGAYITGPVNVRDLNNNLVARLDKGKYIEVKLIGNAYHFNWEGREVKIHKNFAKFDSPVKAKVEKTVNVRDISGKIIGQKKAGDLINVVSMGDYYRFFEAGREVFIWYSFVHIL